MTNNVGKFTQHEWNVSVRETKSQIWVAVTHRGIGERDPVVLAHALNKRAFLEEDIFLRSKELQDAVLAVFNTLHLL